MASDIAHLRSSSLSTMEDICTAYRFDDLELELERELWPTSLFSDDTSILASCVGYQSPGSKYKDHASNQQSAQDAISLSCVSVDDPWSSTRRSRAESSDSVSTLLDELLSEQHGVAVTPATTLPHKSPNLVKDSAPESRREKRQREQKEKRRQQNRIAQQRFREGKEAKMKEACDRIILLETRLKFQIERNCLLEREWLKMKTEIDRLRFKDSSC